MSVEYGDVVEICVFTQQAVRRRKTLDSWKRSRQRRGSRLKTVEAEKEVDLFSVGLLSDFFLNTLQIRGTNLQPLKLLLRAVWLITASIFWCKVKYFVWFDDPDIWKLYPPGLLDCVTVWQLIIWAYFSIGSVKWMFEVCSKMSLSLGDLMPDSKNSGWKTLLEASFYVIMTVKIVENVR